MLSSKFVDFKGFVAPVFTPYDDDGSLNLELIDAYGSYLKTNNVPAILVNGSTGEGTLLTLEERKQLAETWRTVCNKYGILMLVMITGCNFKGVEELATHAEQIKADGVLCLPELYYKPKSIEKLVEYMKDISSFCPTLPLYYYHYPARTNVTFFMPDFMQEAKKEIPNFRGIKFTSSDLREGTQCLKHGQVFLGAAPIILGAMSLGFNSGIMTVLNVFPEYIFQIQENLFNGNIMEAKKLQDTMNEEIKEILKMKNGAWAAAMKAEFNKRNPHIYLGDTRKPLN